MRMLVFALVGCILCAATAQADPSRTVRYLMGESVSLFEWGIFRLQTRAQSFGWDDLEVRKQFARVDYDWAKNQLRIQVTLYPSYRRLQKRAARLVLRLGDAPN